MRISACLVCLALGLSEGSALAQGDPSKSGITAKNAHLVRKIKEVSRKASRIRPTPRAGELLLLEYEEPSVVVDDVNLEPVGKGYPREESDRLRFSLDGKLRLWRDGENKAFRVQNVASGKSVSIPVPHDPNNAVFSPDGKLVAVGYIFSHPQLANLGHSETLIYTVSGQLVHQLGKTFPGGLTPVFSPDGKLLAVGNRNAETHLFEVATGKLLHTLNKRMTQEIAFSPDGKWLATGYVDGTVGLWEVATGKQLHAVASGCEEIYSVDWNPRGDVLATSGRNGKIILWEPKKMTKLKELDAPDWVVQVRFTADGRRLLTAGGLDGGRTDRKITIWSVLDSGEK